MLDNFDNDSIKFEILKYIRKILRNFKKFIIKFPFCKKNNTLYSVLPLRTSTTMKMLMSKLESFDGHFKVTSTCQCENTISSAL